VRTVATVLGLFGVATAAFIVVSQFGGLDRQEFAGLMDGPKPEQARLSPDSGTPSVDGAAGEAPEISAVPPPTGTTVEPEPRQRSVAQADPPPSDLVTSTVRSVRNVTGPGMTPVQVPTGELEREPVPKRPPPPPRWKVFSPVTVQEAGLLGAGPRTIRLAGIVPPAGGRQCRPLAGGETAEMPCDRLATIALRKRIRAFGVECRVAAEDPADPVLAPCRIGKTDLSLWMIEQGWAEAAKRAPEGYAAAEKEARCARRGMWQGEGPPADCLQN
jgi:endonuclease YncB( thermonuclease family)